MGVRALKEVIKPEDRPTPPALDVRVLYEPDFDEKKYEQKKVIDQTKKTDKKKQFVLKADITADEQDILNQKDHLYKRKRLFTKIIRYADKIKFVWSHPQVLDEK